MNFSARLAAGLSVELEVFTTSDGKIINARYPWLIDTHSYFDPIKRCATILAEISNDLLYFEASEKWNMSSATWR